MSHPNELLPTSADLVVQKSMLGNKKEIHCIGEAAVFFSSVWDFPIEYAYFIVILLDSRPYMGKSRKINGVFSPNRIVTLIEFKKDSLK